MQGFLTAIESGRVIVACLSMVAVLSGCGVIKDRSADYQQERLASDLELPEGLSRERISPLYPVPEGEGQVLAGVGGNELPPPPDLTDNILDENYVVETAGEGQSWLLINELPGQVWPAVAAFLLERGLELEYDNPRIGLMQTTPAGSRLKARQWLGLEDSEMASGPVLQARVSPGVRRNTTEVQLRVREEENHEGFLQWSPRPEAPGLERRLLEDMATALKDQEDVKSYSRAALDIAESPRVRLIAPEEGEPRIVLDLEYERAWAEVTRALSEADVPIVDINRSQGLWFVDYRSRDDRTSGWLFWKKLDEPKFTYQVELKRAEDDSLTVVTQPAPDHEEGDRSARLLSEIFEYLY